MCLLEFVKILIFITVDIFKHCQKNKKIKRADQVLPEVDHSYKWHGYNVYCQTERAYTQSPWYHEDIVDTYTLPVFEA